MAWLAQSIVALKKSGKTNGIVYTLTRGDAERIAQWLCFCGIKAQSYHAGSGKARIDIEKKFLESNKTNGGMVLVATVAIGMGFDKPDVDFVIHFQRPASIAYYYQQVGRAGRDKTKSPDAYGALLLGDEDEEIHCYLSQEINPSAAEVAALLDVLREHEGHVGVTSDDLQKWLNFSFEKIGGMLNILRNEDRPPVSRETRKKSDQRSFQKFIFRYCTTAHASDYEVDAAQKEALALRHREEWLTMQEYAQHDGCLMAFLQKTLEDNDVKVCGVCAHCNPKAALPSAIDLEYKQKALDFSGRRFCGEFAASAA